MWFVRSQGLAADGVAEGNLRQEAKGGRRLARSQAAAARPLAARRAAEARDGPRWDRTRRAARSGAAGGSAAGARGRGGRESRHMAPELNASPPPGGVAPACAHGQSEPFCCSLTIYSPSHRTASQRRLSAGLGLVPLPDRRQLMHLRDQRTDVRERLQQVVLAHAVLQRGEGTLQVCEQTMSSKVLKSGRCSAGSSVQTGHEDE